VRATKFVAPTDLERAKQFCASYKVIVSLGQNLEGSLRHSESWTLTGLRSLTCDLRHRVELYEMCV
jgi:hypothetical protein